jgi:putative membrane protein
MSLRDLPLLNASLNSITTCLLLAGWWFIRRDRKPQHIACMAAALVTSTLFLVSYLYYHAHAGSIRFTATGPVRPVYFAILISHTILAAAVVPLVIATVIPAFRARYDRHRRLARWTLPIWLYVSTTGVLVYLMLYRWWPSAEIPR